MLCLYIEAVKAGIPSEHIDHHESDLYLKRTPKTQKLVEAYKKEHGPSLITLFRSVHPDDTGAVWYDIPFHYAPWWWNDGRGI